jgi:hypothetical protein
MDLSRWRKCRLWYNDFNSEYVITSTEVIEKSITSYAENNKLEEKVQIAIEVILPGGPSSYALIGFDFYPGELHSNKIDVSVLIDSTDIIYTNSLAYRNETVMIGIPKEYSQAILKGATKSLEDIGSFPPGRMVFNIGAHSNVGSSKVAFALATKLLLILFQDVIENIDHEQLKVKIDALLSRRLFENWDFLKE